MRRLTGERAVAQDTAVAGGPVLQVPMAPPYPFRPELMQSVVRRALLDRLRDMQSGSRLPPIRDLARELGVGQSSLFRAIREMANEGLVYSRPKLGTFLAKPIQPVNGPKRPERLAATSEFAARAPAEDTAPALPLTGKRVALVTHVHTDELFTAMAQSVASALRALGASVVEHAITMTGPPDFDAEERPQLAILFNPPRMPLPNDPDQPHWLVISTSWRHQIAPLTYDLVGVDQEGGAFLAGDYFRRLGFPSACFVGRKSKGEDEFDAVSACRLRGLEEGFGRAIPPQHQIDSSKYSVIAGGKAFRQYWAMQSRPEGVFAVCDDIAVGFLAAAAAQRVKAGRDFHLIGFDGQAMGQRLPEGPLSTIEVPASSMSRTAIDVATSRLLNTDQPFQATYLSCHLLRGTTVRSSEAQHPVR